MAWRCRARSPTGWGFREHALPAGAEEEGQAQRSAQAGPETDVSRGFLSRWSRRKLAAVAQAEAAAQPAGAPPAPRLHPHGSGSAAARASHTGCRRRMRRGAPRRNCRRSRACRCPRISPPSWKEEVSRRCVAKALQKLFSDPHFNRMDGLDIYIDDYSQPDPIPPEILAKLQHAREWLMDDATAQPAPDGATASRRTQRRRRRAGTGTTAEPAAAEGARLRKRLRLLRVGDASTICRARCRRSRRRVGTKRTLSDKLSRVDSDIAQSWLFGDSCGLP